MNKKAFTLVELIVVITILAILWTIAFISFQWYTKSARDSIRINDLKLIEKSLWLYKIETWEYPLPSDPDQVEYESKEVWTQWTVGQSVITNLDKLNKVPRDPLTWSEYTYSRLNTKKELQLACILEWSPIAMIKNEGIKNKNYKNFYNSILLKDIWEKQEITETLFSYISAEAGIYEKRVIPQANAADVKTTATAYVTWDYNWQIAKVNSWSTTYILAVPSIINWDMTLTDIISIISNKKLVYTWHGNLPDSYTWTVFKMNWWFDYSQTWWIIVYSWSINDLKTDEDARIELITNLQGVYSWTILKNTWNIKKLLETDIDTDTPSDEAKLLACWTIDFWLGTDTMEEGCENSQNEILINDTISDRLDNLIWYYHDSMWLTSVIQDGDYYIVTWYSDWDLSTLTWWTTSPGGSDFLIAKYDKDLNLVKINNLSWWSDDFFYSVTSAQDWYIAVWYTESDLTSFTWWTTSIGEDFVIAKYDKDLNLIRIDNLSGNRDEYFQWVIRDWDYYIAVWNSNSDLDAYTWWSINYYTDPGVPFPIPWKRKFVMAKYDEDLNLVKINNWTWPRSPSQANDFYEWVIVDEDSYIAIWEGTSDLSTFTWWWEASSIDFVIAKHDKDLNLIEVDNSVRFVGHNDVPYSIIKDGWNYVVVWDTKWAEDALVLVKYNANLDPIKTAELWSDININGGFRSVLEDQGGYTIVWYTNSDLSSLWWSSTSWWADYMIARYNSSLDLIEVNNFWTWNDSFSDIIKDWDSYIAVWYWEYIIMKF